MPGSGVLPQTLHAWLEQRFDDVEAPRATEAIAFHREQRAQEHGRALSYEIICAPGETLAELLGRVGPKFSGHMESVGLPAHGHPSVFLSVFAGDRLYFLECAAWRSALAAQPPLMLPAPKI